MSLDETAIIGGLVALHWLGIALGLGSAVLANINGLRVMLLAGPGPSARLFSVLHRCILTSLFVMLASGTGLLILRTSMSCESVTAIALPLTTSCLPGKLGIKLPLILVLIGVAVMIDAHLMPLLRRPQRPLLPALSAKEICDLAMIEAASLSCWGTVTAIANIRELQSEPPLPVLAAVAGLWILLASLIMAGLAALRMVMLWKGRRPAAPPAARTAIARLRLAAVGPHVRRPSPDGGSPAMATFGMRALRAASAHRSFSAPASETAAHPPGTTMSEALAVCRPVVVGLLFVSLVINVLMLTGPLYMLQIYDRVLTSRSRETLVLLTILLVGLLAALGLLEVIRARVLARLSLRFDRLVGPDLVARAIMPVGLGASGSPALLRDLEQVRNFVSGPLPPALLDLPWAPLYFALIFLLHPILGIVTLIGAGVLLALSLASQLVTRKRMATASEEAARCHELAEAGRQSAEVLQAMGMAAAHRARWLTVHRTALSRQSEAGDTASGFATSIRIGRLLLQSLILATGAWLALNDMVSAGAMVAASLIASRAMAPLEQLITQWRNLVASRAAFERCRTALQAPIATNTGIALPEPTGALSVARLYVSPPGHSDPTIKGVGFSLRPGDALAVIGPSASGKSTLARALVGVWPARHGDIRLDGASLAQWDPDALGRHIGYLPQDVALIEGTIAQNIARLAPEPDPASVIAAATVAGVHEMILRLEKGYATEVGPRGVALSGGQRQRIALARALYGCPALVVLDEPNANLDSSGDAALVSAIMALRHAQRTVVVMAHRRTVLKACNRVLLLKDGRQSAFGSPSEVLGGEHQPIPKYRQEQIDAGITRLHPVVAGPRHTAL